MKPNWGLLKKSFSEDREQGTVFEALTHLALS
jgi:hypothetical protein